MYFTIIDNHNNEFKLKMIHTFSHSNINYIIYLDKDDEIYASRYHLKDGKYILNDIVDDAEWDIVDNELAKLEGSYE